MSQIKENNSPTSNNDKVIEPEIKKNAKSPKVSPLSDQKNSNNTSSNQLFGGFGEELIA